VRADRPADVEARDVRSSVIGRILEQAIDRREADEEFQRLGEDIADRQSAIQDKHFAGPLSDISEKFTAMVGDLARGRAISVKPVIPAFKPPQVQFRVEVADGSAATRVEQQGHGFRRALLITALRLLADSTAASSNRVICLAIEEPELFQHPVQARTFAMVLRKLVDDRRLGVHVAYATHSPFFLEAEGFTQIRRVTRSAGDGCPSVVVTSASSGAIEDRLANITDPADVRRQLSGVFLQQLPEAMFASVVILVEGTCDQAVLEGCALRTDPLNANGSSSWRLSGRAGFLSRTRFSVSSASPVRWSSMATQAQAFGPRRRGSRASRPSRTATARGPLNSP
jgi:putative ATP-dependent endonuclease of OLD family